MVQGFTTCRPIDGSNMPKTLSRDFGSLKQFRETLAHQLKMSETYPANLVDPHFIFPANRKASTICGISLVRRPNFSISHLEERIGNFKANYLQFRSIQAVPRCATATEWVRPHPPCQFPLIWSSGDLLLSP